MTLPTPSPQTSNVDRQPPATGPDARDDVAAALGRIPSGLFVVTWRAGGQDRGMLASWVMQCGFEPPMITVAVARSRDLLAAVETGTPFVVNVLAEHQRPLLARFGKPGADAFEGLSIDRTTSGVASLAEAAAWLECVPVSTAGGNEHPGDHVVVLGRVGAAKATGDRQPLVHVRRNGLRY